MLELFIYGLVLGSIIGLASVGLTLIWGITDLFNCAHGDQITAGAYTALLFVTMFNKIGILKGIVGPFSFSWAVVISFIPAILVSIILAILIDRWVYKPLRKAGATSITGFVASIGVAWTLRGIIYLIWGADFHFYNTGLRPTIILHNIGIKFRVDEIFIVIISWITVAAVYLFLSRTKMGKALRALSDNPSLAQVTGINTERMLIWAWGIAGLLIAISGVLYGIETQLRPEMGWIFLMPLFAAVILGGQGSITGALVGGLVLGIAQQMSTAFMASSYKPAVAFIIMILVLIFRPRGILGRRYS